MNARFLLRSCGRFLLVIVVRRETMIRLIREFRRKKSKSATYELFCVRGK